MDSRTAGNNERVSTLEYSDGRPVTHITVVDRPAAVEITIRPLAVHVLRPLLWVVLASGATAFVAAVASANRTNAPLNALAVAILGVVLEWPLLKRLLLALIPLHMYAGDDQLVVYRYGWIKGPRISLPRELVADVRAETRADERGGGAAYAAKVVLELTDGRNVSLGKGTRAEVATIVHHLRRGLSLSGDDST
jgi:hypothetical protein